MRPATVITGIVLGSCVSITVSLAGVIIVFWVLGTENPRIAHESEGLAASSLIFLALTAISAMSFYSLLKDQRFRWWWQGCMWISVIFTVLYFLPEGSLAS